MSKVPSELLEGPLMKIMGILFHEYAAGGCTDEGFKILLREARALGIFIGELGATHCSMAFTNKVRSLLWEAERSPEALKKLNQYFLETFEKVKKDGI